MKWRDVVNLLMGLASTCVRPAMVLRRLYTMSRIRNVWNDGIRSATHPRKAKARRRLPPEAAAGLAERLVEPDAEQRDHGQGTINTADPGTSAMNLLVRTVGPKMFGTP
jgi:hypothetical protein